MTRMTRFAFILLWLVSLAIVGVFASASAQTIRDTSGIISGTDIGFRPEGWKGKARVGTWMVRINGEWVEAQTSMRPTPATTR